MWAKPVVSLLSYPILLDSPFSSPAHFFQNQHFDGFVVEVWSQLLSQKHV